MCLQIAGILKDDVVMAVNGETTLWSTHAEVVDLVKKSGRVVSLTVTSFTRVRRSNVLPPTQKDSPSATHNSNGAPSGAIEDAMQY